MLGCPVPPILGQQPSRPAPDTSVAPSSTGSPQSSLLAGQSPDSRKSRIDQLAARIAAAATDAEADSALAAEADLAGADLARAVLQETFRLRNEGVSAERILVINLRLLRLTGNRNMADARGIAQRGLGLAYANLGNWTLAEKELSMAMAFLNASGAAGQQDLLLTTRDLAGMYYRKGDFPKALDQYERVRVLADWSADSDSLVYAYNGLAITHLGQGRIGKAVEAYDLAYRTALASGSPVSVNYLFQSAITQIKLGDLSAAYSKLRKVISESASAADRRLYIHALLNIAWIHKQHAQEKKAIELYERASSLADKEISSGAEASRRGYISVKAEAVNRLAEIHTERGDTAVAIGLYTGNLQMLRLASSGADPDPRTRVGSHDVNRVLEVGINRSLGELYGSIASNDQASAHFAAALDLSQKLGYQAGSIDTLLSMATHAANGGNTQQAFSYVDRVNALVQSSGRLDQLLKLKTITAAVQRRLNRPAAADLTYQEAVRISESLRSDVTMPDQRASYFSSLFAPFDEYIDFLMERHEKEPDAGFDRKAFDVSERRRARALLDSLKVARADIRQGVDAGLLEQENRIRNQLNAVARKQFTTADLGWKSMIDADPIDAPISSSRSDIAFLTAELARVETAIRRQSPRYAELMLPRPLRWGGIQTLLDERTVLLNYTLGEKRSYLWTITQGAVNSFILPPRSKIETLVKTVYGEQSDGTIIGEAEFSFTPAAEALSRILLEPASDVIGTKRVVIVGDGALQYLPFSSLPDPRSRITTKGPMLLSNEIQFAPSASVVAVLRQEAERRPSPPKSLAIFADPVFSEGDERFDDAASGVPVSDPAVEGSVSRDLLDIRVLTGKNAVNVNEIPRLPFSRREAEAIFSNAPEGISFKAVDFEASREKVASIDLSKYGIVHFATHGILHSEYPELSGVVLSLFNEKGEPVNGFLRLNEIYNMKLNADLVVLSACQTALGKEVRGEGLIGLTRGFMYAGSPRVVASLWKVDDVATAELMQIFYQKMLKENMSPSSALRAAKTGMMKQKRWRSPYYWAGFELQGEWR